MRGIVRALPVATAIALSISAVGASAAGTTAASTFKSTVKLGRAKVTNGTVTQRGTFTSSRGRGKAVLLSKGGNGSFQSTMKLTFGNGSITFKGHSTTTGAADPSKYSIRGTWKVTGGTRKYRHARGKVSVLGLGVNDLSSAKMTLKGTVKT